MGLLDRIRSLDKITAPQSSIFSSIPYSPAHIDFPGAVFRTFQSLLKFNKGALLLPNPGEKEYYPWISVGFDRTTTRRLKISENFPVLQSGDNVVMSFNTSELTGMLSNRELGMTENLVLIRLGDAFPPPALIIASDMGKSCISAKIESEIQLFSKTLGEEIVQSRVMIQGASGDDNLDLIEWFDSRGKDSAVLLTIDITHACDTFIASVSGLEPYRARKDVVNLIRYLTGRMGLVYDLENGMILILFPRKRLPDYKLFIYHLSHTFSTLFYTCASPPEFPVTFNLWPEEKDAVKESLAGFF